MKKITMAICAALLFTGCLFSKKDEPAPAAEPQAAPAEQAPAPTGDANAPANNAAPAEPRLGNTSDSLQNPKLEQTSDARYRQQHR